MSDLAAFLLAQIAEDKAAALPEADVRPGDRDSTLRLCDDKTGVVDYSCVRVLAECEAKKRIVRLYQEAATMDRGAGHWPQNTSCWCVGCAECIGAHDAFEEAVRLLASSYAGRPGFREEWAL